MKKFISIFVVILLIITSAGATAVFIKEKNTGFKWELNKSKASIFFDELDQNQSLMDWFGPVGPCPLADGAPNYILVQSFIPTKNVLTKVELMIGKNSTTIHDYRVAIRSNLSGVDLTSISIPAANVTTENFSWEEFDFPDISVTPGNTYYIVSSTANVTDNWYVWGLKMDGNTYPQGTIYFSIDDEQTWAEEPGGDMTFKTYGIDNQPPNPPVINGKTKIKVGILYEYTFVSTDDNGDEVYYCIDWDDGTPEVCIGPYASGVEAKATHTWTTKGAYIIKVKAKDIYNAESGLSTFEITVPRTTSIYNLFQRFIKYYSHAFPVIRLLMKL